MLQNIVTQSNRRNIIRCVRNIRRRRQQLKNVLVTMLEQLLISVRLYTPFHLLLDSDYLYVQRLLPLLDIEAVIQHQPSLTWFLTGETPESFTNLLHFLSVNIQEPLRTGNHHSCQRIRRLEPRYELILTLIWMRHYPTLATLGGMCGLSPSNVHYIIRHIILICNELLLPREVYWHTLQGWDAFEGISQEGQ
jgi:hypothetical protein